MDATQALTVIISLALVPALVWGLAKSKLTGDQKRLVVLIFAILLGVIQAVITGIIVLPYAWLDAIVRGLIMLAGVVTTSQAMYVLLRGKLGGDSGDDPAGVGSADAAGDTARAADIAAQVRAELEGMQVVVQAPGTVSGQVSQ